MIKEASYFSLGQDCLKTETQDMVTLLSLGFRWLQTVKEISSLETLCLSPVDQSLDTLCLSPVDQSLEGE